MLIADADSHIIMEANHFRSWEKSKDVLRQQSEGAEGDGSAHQLDLQVFFWHPSIGEVDHFFRLGTFRTELVLVFGSMRMWTRESRGTSLVLIFYERKSQMY